MLYLYYWKLKFEKGQTTEPWIIAEADTTWYMLSLTLLVGLESPVLWPIKIHIVRTWEVNLQEYAYI